MRRASRSLFAFASSSRFRTMMPDSFLISFLSFSSRIPRASSRPSWAMRSSSSICCEILFESSCSRFESRSRRVSISFSCFSRFLAFASIESARRSSSSSRWARRFSLFVCSRRRSLISCSQSSRIFRVSPLADTRASRRMCSASRCASCRILSAALFAESFCIFWIQLFSSIPAAMPMKQKMQATAISAQ